MKKVFRSEKMDVCEICNVINHNVAATQLHTLTFYTLFFLLNLTCLKFTFEVLLQY